MPRQLLIVGVRCFLAHTRPPTAVHRAPAETSPLGTPVRALRSGGARAWRCILPTSTDALFPYNSTSSTPEHFYPPHSRSAVVCHGIVVPLRPILCAMVHVRYCGDSAPLALHSPTPFHNHAGSPSSGDMTTCGRWREHTLAAVPLVHVKLMLKAFECSFGVVQFKPSRL